MDHEFEEKINELNNVRIIHPTNDFYCNRNCICIYMDEKFSSDGTKGAIGGIVWNKINADYSVLQSCANHLQQSQYGRYDLKQSRLESINRLQQIMECPDAIPFVFSFKNRTADDYLSILNDALWMLLGWFLPAPANNGEVAIKIVMEQFSQYKNDTDYTTSLKTLLAHYKSESPGLFSHWNIETVKWKKGDFEYLGYADLICYPVFQEGDYGNAVFEAARYTQWPFYAELTPDLVSQIRSLTDISLSNADNILAFLTEQPRNAFLLEVTKKIRDSINQKPDIVNSLIHTLEEKFQKKSRNIPELHQLVKKVVKIITPLPDQIPFYVKLNFIALQIQDANHRGAPEEAKKLIESYRLMRDQAIQHIPDLVAYLDAIIAVSFNDQFDFETSEEILTKIFDDDRFEYLSPYAKARIYSSIGQIHSIKREHDEADAYFAQAIDLFQKADLDEKQKNGEVDQTNVYRTINSMDSEKRGENLLLKTVKYDNFRKAALEFSKKKPDQKPYHHHVLLRYFFQNKDNQDVRSAINKYLAEKDKWKYGDSHPWELIGLYRGLLLHHADSNANIVCGHIAKAVAIAENKIYGATMQFIGAVICCVAASIVKNSEEKQNYLIKAKNLLKESKPKLADTAGVTDKLEEIVKKIDENNNVSIEVNTIIEILPFNYH